MKPLKLKVVDIRSDQGKRKVVRLQKQGWYVGNANDTTATLVMPRSAKQRREIIARRPHGEGIGL